MHIIQEGRLHIPLSLSLPWSRRHLSAIQPLIVEQDVRAARCIFRKKHQKGCQQGLLEARGRMVLGGMEVRCCARGNNFRYTAVRSTTQNPTKRPCFISSHHPSPSPPICQHLRITSTLSPTSPRLARSTRTYILSSGALPSAPYPVKCFLEV